MELFKTTCTSINLSPAIISKVLQIDTSEIDAKKEMIHPATGERKREKEKE